MNRLIALLLACLWATAAPPAAAQPQAQAASAALRTLFSDEWERTLRDSPETASYNGDVRYDDRWTDLSRPAIAAREAADRAALARLRSIDRAALAPAERLQYDTFAWQLQHAVDRQRFREWLQPIGHQGGVQSADNIAEAMPFATGADYRRFMARIAALPTLVEQTIGLMRDGLRENALPPRVLMERVPAQITLQLVDDPTQSPFYRPFLKLPDTLPPAERSALQAEAQALIRSRVVPAYRALQTFVDASYLPRTRSSIAISDAADGKAHYDFLAGYYTTTDLDAATIHTIGLAEVARLRAAMERVKGEAGFGGSLGDFFTHLRTDPKFFYPTPQALLDGYRATAKRIDPELLKVFRTIPRLPYGVRGIPDNIAPASATGYYQGGAADGTRPGYLSVNLYRPEMRPRWEMLPLTLHEGVPGHHFQFARALELPNAPLLLKTAYFVAYGEGWALYAEKLGHDMGLYQDPYERFGQLTYEMWRAVRLVIDTGIHSKGWSREQAIAYFKDNAAKTELDIVNEVDRYIGMPGQALAYKIGEMTISALRERAQRELGPRFDLRDFNDAVLATGSVPLAALQARIAEWIAERGAR